MFVALVFASLLLPHGGQYLPPHPEPAIVRPPIDDAPTQPGYGPYLELQPERWEWWFDFNREEIVDRRQRMRMVVPGGDDSAFQEVDDATRVERVLPVLRAALEHHNRDVRASATMSMARLGISSALPSVVARTKDRDLFVRTQAVLSLGFAHEATTAPSLEAILREPKHGSEIRMCAAVGLGLLATPECIAALERYLPPAILKKQDYLLQAGLVYAAGVPGEAAPLGALQRLEGSWLVQQDARLRALLAVSFGRSGTEAGLSAVLRLLGDNDSEVRRSASAALEGVAHLANGSQALLIIELAGKESDLSARANLCRAMGRVRRPETRAYLLSQLDKGSTWVRPHVALGLGLDGDPANGDVLLERLDNLHELSTRGALITALALLGDARVVPILQEELKGNREPTYVSVLCRAAGLVGETDPEIVERLAELAGTDHNVEVARLATLGLGLLGQRDQVAVLADSAGEVLSTVDRAARAFALGQVGDETTIASLLALAQDERQPSYVIAYAIQALGEVCDARARSPVWRLSRHVNMHHDVPEIFELYRML